MLDSMVEMTKALALDIETTGLDPREHSVVAVGLADGQGAHAYLGSEDSILRSVESHIATQPLGSLLITWNGEEFDLPFLRTRFGLLGIRSSLKLRSRNSLGKYGKPVYEAAWGRVAHVDIAPYFRTRAEELGVRWSLKPVARALLGEEPVEVDNRGESIAAMDKDTLTRYVLSDVTLTFTLAAYLNEAEELVDKGSDDPESLIVR